MLQYYRIVVEGYKLPAQPAALVYGVAVHKFTDSMYKTSRPDLARDAALKEFRKPKYDNKKSMHLSDEHHLIPTCFNLWDDYVKKDKEFSLVLLNQPCPWCGGDIYHLDYPAKNTETTEPESVMIPCGQCNGTGKMLLPASEVTFEIDYYEDEFVKVVLAGTIDGIGKITNGCYAIRDFKTTSSSEQDEYLDDYEMSAQLRFYLFSLILMHRLHPESPLGQIGGTRIGAFIDGVFIRPKILNNEYVRSKVFQFPEDEMAEFETNLNELVKKISRYIETRIWQRREGIVNGTCKSGYRKCDFWFPCHSGNKAISNTLLSTKFIKKQYDPLHHND